MDLEFDFEMMLDAVRSHLKYELLPTSDTGSIPERSIPEKRTSRSDRIKIFSALGVILGVLVVVGLGLRFIIEESSKKNAFLTSCGSSREEAITNGCKFDVMSFGWMPPMCFDEALCKEFCDARKWDWYLDENQTQSVPTNDIEEGKFAALYISREYQVFQCMYMWKKLHRAVLSKSPLDGLSGKYNNTVHCGQVLSQESDHGSKRAILMITQYPSCGT